MKRYSNINKDINNKIMFCLDLDGTLLKSDKTIGKKTIDLLNSLNPERFLVTIATGRHYDYAMYLTHEIKNKFIIANNGAGIFDCKTEVCISENPITLVDTVKLTRLALKLGLDPIIYVNGAKYGYDMMVSSASDKSYYTKHLVRNTDRIKDFSELEDLKEAMSFAIYGSKDKLYDFKDYLSESFKHLNYHIIYSSYDDLAILEVMDKNVNKWIAISKFAAIKGVDFKNIISFGDQVNDLEMLENSGVGVAMKGSNEALVSRANRTSEFSNDEDGVYYEVKKILKENYGL